MPRDLVLIHGMWSTGEHWSTMSEMFGRAGYRCHAPTLPYHVAGDVPHERIGNVGISDYVDALVEYVDSLGLDAPPVYVGHSMGGLLAQLLAVQRPAAALVLLAPAPPAGVFGIHPRSLWSFLPILSRWEFWSRPHRLSRERADWGAWNGTDPKHADELYPTLVWESGRALAEIAFWLLDPRHSTRLDYSKLQMPALFISAENDRLVPPGVVISGANAYPRAEYHAIDEMHHWLIDEWISADLASHIDRWILQNTEGHPGA